MSIGNLKDQGNKGNNFPYQLRNLQLLGSIDQGITNLVSGGINLENTATDSFGRLRVSEPFTLFDSSNRYSDNGLWATDTAGGAGSTATFNADQGLVDLTISLNSGDYVKRETYRVFSYQPGKSLLILNTFVMNTPVADLTQRVGYYGENNGYFLDQTGTNISFVERTSISGSPADTYINKTAWNYDKLDGTGPSGYVLDLTKAQILWIDMEWLGVGSVRMGFVIDGKFILCHTFQHANLIDSTYITTACLPLRYEIISNTNVGGPVTLKQICSSVISEGGYELRGKPNSVTTGITTPVNIVTPGVYYPIISMRLKSDRLDAIVIPKGVSVLPGSTGNYSFVIITGGITTAGTWIDAGSDSAVEYNLTGTSIAGGSTALHGFFAQTNQASSSINISGGDLFRYQLDRNSFTLRANEFTLAIAAATIGGGGVNLYGAIDWEEISR
jgi:hypothetical protein